jgi:galactokinase
MGQMINELVISTPGRICLFGEHQDYLKLPIVASAISLRIYIRGRRRKDKLINIDLPDISGKKTFKLEDSAFYIEERDYFKSSINVLQRNSFTFSSGFDCIVEGKIPINAGTSSSSALTVTWINFLTRMSDQCVALPPEQLARYAYEAEVLEFSEPGGMMDQYSTSYGGIIAMDFSPRTIVTRIDKKLKTFVLGNSGEPKNTMFILNHVKNRILDVDNSLRKMDSDFSLLNVSLADLPEYRKYLSEVQYLLLEGTIKIRDITRIARHELNHQVPDDKVIGDLLNEHQIILREVLGISTSKIDAMITASLNAGALGAKINGSGGGGCMFAYAPGNPEKVKKAIEDAGGEAFIIIADSGSRDENCELNS